MLFATLTAVWIYCLPCTCAGMQYSFIRSYAQRMQRRLPCWLLFATFVNGAMMFLIITWLPDWGYGDYIKCVAGAALFAAKNAMKAMVSIALIVVFVFVFVFRDRFMAVAGIDYKTIFRFKLRDVFGVNKRPIEICIHRVDHLPSASFMAPNNVFIECYLGYNEPMKTRVHNGAGSQCSFKEAIQLNFDEDEFDEPLHLFVKNQKVVGAGELARLELKAEEVAVIEKESIEKKQRYGAQWTDDAFVCRKLMPKGEIWFRVIPVEDDDDASKTVMC